MKNTSPKACRRPSGTDRRSWPTRGRTAVSSSRIRSSNASTGERQCALEMNALPALADAIRENDDPGREYRTLLWGRTVLDNRFPNSPSEGYALATAQGSPIRKFLVP